MLIKFDCLKVHTCTCTEKTFELHALSLSYTRIYSYSVKTNLMLDNEEEAISELKLFKQAGGGTLCDVTTVGIRFKKNWEQKCGLMHSEYTILIMF